MAIDICNRFGNVNMKADELIKNISVTNTTLDDIPYIIMFLTKAWNLKGYSEAYNQIVHANINLNVSVKAIDKRDGEIYGLLLIAHYPISEGSPIMECRYDLGKYLSQYSHINGHSFIIDERLRGNGIDKQMLKLQNKFINNYDFIWCAVEKDLKSHNYWKKVGFKNIFSIPDATFYIKANNKNIVWDIYRYYDVDFRNEKNIN